MTQAVPATLAAQTSIDAAEVLNVSGYIEAVCRAHLRTFLPHDCL